MDTYEAIVACLLKENSNNTNKEIVSDINENGAMTKSRGQSAKFAYEVRNGFTSPRLKKKKTEEEFSEEFQKKLSIFKLVKSDPKNWFKEPDCKHISSFFCEKAKEIRTIELLHTHFVLTSSG
jgi:beta-glucanase (GH16 family)